MTAVNVAQTAPYHGNGFNQTLSQMRDTKQKGYRRFNRVGDSLQQVIAEAIERKVDDPRLGFVTVTHVEAAPDLRTAKVFVSVLGGGDDADLRSIAALKDAAFLIQREIAGQMRMKWTPRLTFIADDTPAKADHIERVMRDVRDAQADAPVSEEEGDPT